MMKLSLFPIYFVQTLLKFSSTGNYFGNSLILSIASSVGETNSGIK